MVEHPGINRAASNNDKLIMSLVCDYDATQTIFATSLTSIKCRRQEPWSLPSAFNVMCNKKQKKQAVKTCFPCIVKIRLAYALCNFSSETVSFFLPFALRAANTRRPFLVAILSRKPCLFLRFLCDGWNVLFIAIIFPFLYFDI